MGRRKKARNDDDNGFAQFGGYMAAKRAKLSEQFDEGKITKLSDIFKGIAIFINGYTNPSMEELRRLMAVHGGTYHMYQISGQTTHIIASNLPDFKIKQLGNLPVVKPEWITDSITMGKLLDYKRYMLYTNQSRTQPRLEFPVIIKSDSKFVDDIKPINTDIKKDIGNTLIGRADLQNTDDASSILKDVARKPTLTASDPKFLAEFYNNSRLHLISTLGAEFKQLVCQLREKSTGKFPGRDKLKLLEPNAKWPKSSSVVMHIDMDCFFVSVGLRQRPDLKGKPVAVTHARNTQNVAVRPGVDLDAELALCRERFREGVVSKLEKIEANDSRSEIASCSYEARACGVKNGMFLGTALKLCPDLQTIPYDFQGYREVSATLYNTIASYTLDIEAVSCDEMYVNIGPILDEAGVSVDNWARHVRSEIVAATGCPCSTGFGANRLQARLATRKAKPAGQFHLRPEDVETYMAEVPLADLPGVGRATLAKLKALNFKSCGDVQGTSLSLLQTELGMKNGETLYEQIRGVDSRPLNFQHERKSVSADVNYGIRFKTNDEALSFLKSLSDEVYTRLTDIGMRTRCLTLKLMVRARNAPQETAKFLGHGVCDTINRSTTTGSIINDSSTVFKEAKSLYERINVPPQDLRGVGIQLTRLEKPPVTNSALAKFFQTTSTKSDENMAALESIDSTNCDRESSNDNFTNVQANDRSTDESDLVMQPSVKTSVTNIKKNAKVEQKNSIQGSESCKTTTGTRKRGRPRGSSNKTSPKIATKKSKPPSNDLNNYFTRTAKTTQPNLQGIDMDVFNQLPEDLKNEIIRDRQVKVQKQPEPTIKKCAFADSQQKLKESKPSTSKSVDIRASGTSWKKSKRENDNEGNIFSGLSWDELKPIVKVWFESEEEPLAVDVQMLAEHFRQLAVNREIEILHPILNFMHRCISKMGKCSWHEAYLTIVNTVQQGMVARYGSTLYVNRHFECPFHTT